MPFYMPEANAVADAPPPEQPKPAPDVASFLLNQAVTPADASQPLGGPLPAVADQDPAAVMNAPQAPAPDAATAPPAQAVQAPVTQGVPAAPEDGTFYMPEGHEAPSFHMPEENHTKAAREIAGSGVDPLKAYVNGDLQDPDVAVQAKRIQDSDWAQQNLFQKNISAWQGQLNAFDSFVREGIPKGIAELPQMRTNVGKAELDLANLMRSGKGADEVQQRAQADLESGKITPEQFKDLTDKASKLADLDRQQTAGTLSNEDYQKQREALVGPEQVGLTPDQQKSARDLLAGTESVVQGGVDKVTGAAKALNATPGMQALNAGLKAIPIIGPYAGGEPMSQADQKQLLDAGLPVPSSKAPLDMSDEELKQDLQVQRAQKANTDKLMAGDVGPIAQAVMTGMNGGKPALSLQDLAASGNPVDPGAIEGASTVANLIALAATPAPLAEAGEGLGALGLQSAAKALRTGSLVTQTVAGKGFDAAKRYLGWGGIDLLMHHENIIPVAKHLGYLAAAQGGGVLGHYASGILEDAATDSLAGRGFIPQLIGRTLKRAASGAGTNLLLVMPSSDPVQLGAAFSSGAALGTAFGLPKDATTAAGSSAFDSAFIRKGKEPTYEPPDTPYGTDPTLDKQSAKAIKDLPDEWKNRVNGVKQLLGDHAEVYVLPPKEFSVYAQQGAGTSGLSPEQVNAAGVTLFRPDNGAPQVFLRSDRVHDALYHETGHALYHYLPEDARLDFKQAYLEKGNADQLVQNYVERFTGQPNELKFADLPTEAEVQAGTPRGPAGLTQETALDEMAADRFHSLFNGQTIDRLTRDPSVARNMQFGLGRVLERFGIPTTTPEAAGILGVRPQFTDALILDQFIRKGFKDVPAPAPDASAAASGPQPAAPSGPAPSGPAPMPSPGARAVAPAAPVVDPAVAAARNDAVAAMRKLGIPLADAQAAAARSTATNASSILQEAVSEIGRQRMQQKAPTMPSNRAPVVATPPPEPQQPRVAPETPEEAAYRKALDAAGKPEAENAATETPAAPAEAAPKAEPVTPEKPQPVAAGDVQRAWNQQHGDYPATGVTIDAEGKYHVQHKGGDEDILDQRALENLGLHGRGAPVQGNATAGAINARVEEPTTAHADKTTWFGLNPDGGIDRGDNGQGYFGHNTRDPNLVGVALPWRTLAGTVGDFTRDPAIEAAIRRGDYKVRVTADNGKTVDAVIADVGPAEWTHAGLDVTYGTGKALGLHGNEHTKFQIIGPDGKPLELKSAPKDWVPKGKRHGPGEGGVPLGGGGLGEGEGRRESGEESPRERHRRTEEPPGLEEEPASTPTRKRGESKPEGEGEPGQETIASPLSKEEVAQAKEEAKTNLDAQNKRFKSDDTRQKALAEAENQTILERHAQALPPGDDRVRLQVDPETGRQVISGSRFVPGDAVHEHLLQGVPEEAKAIADQFSTRIGTNQPVHLTYHSAEAADGGIQAPTAESRGAEQAASPASERAKGATPSTENAVTVIPTSLGVKADAKEGNAVYLKGFSPNKFLTNVAHLVEALKGKSPYDSAHDPRLAADVAKYVENQRHGWKGDGSAPLQGTPDLQVQVARGYAGKPLPRRHADFINAAMNDHSARGTTVKAGAIRSLAELNQGHLTPKGETNPLRELINDSQFGDVAKKLWTQRTLQSPFETRRADLVKELHDAPPLDLPSLYEHNPDVAQAFTEHGLPVQKYVAAGFLPDAAPEKAEEHRMRAHFMPMAGEKATGYDEAKRSGRVFVNPYDKRPRFEVSDKNLRFKTPAGEITPLESKSALADSMKPMRLEDAIRHPQLFEQYPFLKDLTVRTSDAKKPGHADYKPPESKPGEERGERISKAGLITLSTDFRKEDLVHEIQHAIQDYEGRTFGSSSSMASARLDVGKLRQEAYDQWDRENPLRGDYFDYSYGEHEARKKARQDFANHAVNTQAWNEYRRNAGEIEAREAADRSWMGTERLAKQPPYDPVSPGYILPEKAWFLPDAERANDTREKAQREGRALFLPDSQGADRKNLVALHNLSPEGVLAVDRLGGIPVPSLAITKKTIPHDQFGPITLVAHPDVVDPRRTPVFDRDVYSPRQPRMQADYDPDHPASKALEEKVRGSIERMFGKESLYPNVITHLLNGDANLSNAHWDQPAKIAYLKDIGDLPKLESSAISGLSRESEDAINKAISRNGGAAGMTEWLEKQLEPARGEPYFQSKKLGENRPYTLEELTREMTGKIKGQEGTQSLGEAAAKTARRFHSVPDIKSATHQLTDPYEEENYHEETSGQFDKLQRSLRKLPNQGSGSMYYDLSDALKDFNRYSDRKLEQLGDAEAVKQSLARSGLQLEEGDGANPPEEVVRRFRNVAARVRYAPSNYFEAKPQRAVQLKEFKAAVYPEGTHPEVVRALNDAGVNHHETYRADTPDSEEDRRAAVERAAEATKALFLPDAKREAPKVGERQAPIGGMPTHLHIHFHGMPAPMPQPEEASHEQ